MDTTRIEEQSGIRIIQDSTNSPLPARSRVNYTRLYNIDHKLKVKSYGKVDGASLEPMFQQWKAVCIRMYKKNPEALANAIQQPSMRSLAALDLTPKQAKAVLDAIEDGADSRQALIRIAERSAAKQLRSEDAAEVVSKLMLSGLGYLAAVSCARHQGMQSANAGNEEFDQAQQEVRFDDLDAADEIGANNDTASSGELFFS